MATIGIDVGKHQHIAAIHREGEREARRAVLRFGADRQGLAELTSWLAQHGQISRAVLESSGHYHLNLAAALQRAGLPVAVVNPLESKYFGKRRLQRWPWSMSRSFATSSPVPSCARPRASR
jgi:transposase